MRILERIWSWLNPTKIRDSADRVKCSQCSNRVLRDIAASNGGLCGVCFRRAHPKPQRDATKPSPYHQLLDTPVEQLTDSQKRDQLSGAIAWRNEKRIDELLSSSPSFLSKAAKYSSRTWIGEAVHRDCSLSVLNKLLAAGCDPNGYLRSPKESRPLEIAVSQDRLDAIKWLLEHGADPNVGRPVVAAINHEKSPEIQLAMLELLINGGVNVNQTFPLFGNEDKRFTVLDWAVLYGISPEVIDFLKMHGATHHWSMDEIRTFQQELHSRRIV